MANQDFAADNRSTIDLLIEDPIDNGKIEIEREARKILGLRKGIFIILTLISFNLLLLWMIPSFWGPMSSNIKREILETIASSSSQINQLSLESIKQNQAVNKLVIKTLESTKSIIEQRESANFNSPKTPQNIYSPVLAPEIKSTTIGDYVPLAHATLWMSYEDKLDSAIYLCGATMIDSSWLVTAAHCLDRPEITNKLVSLYAILRAYRKSSEPISRLAEIDAIKPMPEDNLPIAVNIIYFRKHPLYDGKIFRERSSKSKYDIAVMQISSYVSPNQTLISWSYFDRFWERETSIEKNVPVIAAANKSQNFDWCQSPLIDSKEQSRISRTKEYPMILTYSYNSSLPTLLFWPGICTMSAIGGSFISEDELCAGRPEIVSGCVPNAGSGLYCLDSKTNRVFLKGVASWCQDYDQSVGGPVDIRRVYADISYHRGWLESHVNSLRNSADHLFPTQ